MAKRNRSGAAPTGLRHNSRGDRRSNTQPRFPQRNSEDYIRPTGAFGSFRTPKVVGIDPENAVLIKDMARRAKREERRWMASLPKGVKV